LASQSYCIFGKTLKKFGKPIKKSKIENLVTLLQFQCLQPKDRLGYGWVFLKYLGFGWVWVFATPVWVGFRFLFFKKPGFRSGFGFFQNLKKIGKFQAKL
jgi:hypothetical protein